MQYWLIKSEPSDYSWDDLLKEKNRTTSWSGVRNYQARNYMRNGMKKGDRVFFYHSVIKPPAIVGIAEITREAYPDPLAFKKGSKYYDPKSDPDLPRWLTVDVRAIQSLDEPITIDELKEISALADMVLLNNTRLSVQPVTKEQWQKIIIQRKTKDL